MRDGVLENVFVAFKAGRFRCVLFARLNKLSALQFSEGGLQFGSGLFLTNIGEHPLLKNPANNRSTLQGLFVLRWQAVNPRRQNAVERFWNFQRLNLAHGRGSAFLQYDYPGVDQGAKKLFDEKWISLGAVQNQFAQPFGKVLDL